MYNLDLNIKNIKSKLTAQRRKLLIRDNNKTVTPSFEILFEIYIYIYIYDLVKNETFQELIYVHTIQ